MIKRWKMRRQMNRHAKAHEWLEVYRIARELGDPHTGLYAMCAAIQAAYRSFGKEDFRGEDLP